MATDVANPATKNRKPKWVVNSPTPTKMGSTTVLTAATMVRVGHPGDEGLQVQAGAPRNRRREEGEVSFIFFFLSSFFFPGGGGGGRGTSGHVVGFRHGKLLSVDLWLADVSRSDLVMHQICPQQSLGVFCGILQVVRGSRDGATLCNAMGVPFQVAKSLGHFGAERQNARSKSAARQCPHARRGAHGGQRAQRSARASRRPDRNMDMPKKVGRDMPHA